MTTLLEAQEEISRLIGDSTEQEHDAAPSSPVSAPHSARALQTRVQFASMILIFVFIFGAVLAIAPVTSIREDIICKAYYRNISPPESRQEDAAAPRDCSVDAVQKELVFLGQMEVTFAEIPSVFLALPYGILADRIGRRKVLLLSIIGVLLEVTFVYFITYNSDIFPLRLIWMGSVFRIFGGGEPVASTVLFASLADVFDEIARPTVFARVVSVILVCQLIAPPISAWLMLRNPWLPYTIALCLFYIGATITASILPETLPLELRSSLTSTPIPFSQRARSLVSLLKRTTAVILSRRNVALLLFGFFTSTIGGVARGFELQYVHRRYGWSYSRAATLMAVRPLTTLFLFLVLVPLSTHVLVVRMRLSTIRKDLILARTSITLLMVGALLLGLSSAGGFAVLSFVVLALGDGYPIIARSLITMCGPKELVGTLYSSISISSAFGALFAGPMIAVTFSWGLSRAGFWVGTPLLFLAVLYSCTLGALALVRIEEKEDERVEN